MAATALWATESPSSLYGELLQLRRARLLDAPEPLDDALVPPHQHRCDRSAEQRERRPEQVERAEQPQRPAADLPHALGSVAGSARSRGKLVHQEVAEESGRAVRLTDVRSWRVALEAAESSRELGRRRGLRGGIPRERGAQVAQRTCLISALAILGPRGEGAIQLRAHLHQLAKIVHRRGERRECGLPELCALALDPPGRERETGDHQREDDEGRGQRKVAHGHRSSSFRSLRAGEALVSQCELARLCFTTERVLAEIAGLGIRLRGRLLPHRGGPLRGAARRVCRRSSRFGRTRCACPAAGMLRETRRAEEIWRRSGCAGSC
jgi:hypothetical protein